MCLEVVWERPPYFLQEEVSMLKTINLTIYKVMKSYDHDDRREDI